MLNDTVNNSTKAPEFWINPMGLDEEGKRSPDAKLGILRLSKESKLAWDRLTKGLENPDNQAYLSLGKSWFSKVSHVVLAHLYTINPDTGKRTRIGVVKNVADTLAPALEAQAVEFCLCPDFNAVDLGELPF